jgi:outer membrane immunogenic protein
MRSKILTTAFLVLCIGSAHAADMPVKAPVVAPPPTWTGFYIGINGGGAWGTVDPQARDAGPDSFFAIGNIAAVAGGASHSFNTSGGLAGGQIGYLYQGGQTILGIEASFDWSGLNGSSSFGPTPYPVTPGSTFAWNLNGKSDWLGLLTGRVGLDMGSWYPYVTAGAAVAHLKYSANFIDTFYPTNNTFNFSRNAVGWVVGAGAEMRVWDHWMLRGEFLHIDFADVGGTGLIACTAGVGACAPGVPNSTNFLLNSHFTENVVRAALSYRF